MKYCECGNKIQNGVCASCGNVYDSEELISYDESSKINRLKNYIIYNSSLLIAEDYIEENIAFMDDIIEDYTKQVKNFLNSITDSELYYAKETILNKNRKNKSELLNTATEILKELGFEFTERE